MRTNVAAAKSIRRIAIAVAEATCRHGIGGRAERLSANGGTGKDEAVLSRKESLRTVRLEHGSLEVTKEVVRDARWESFIETL